MSCWFLINNNNGQWTSQIDNFKRIFSSASSFCFNINEKKINENTSFFIWSWNDLNIYPDISYYYDSALNSHIIIDGFISDFGKYGNASEDKVSNAKKAFSLYMENRKYFISELNGSFSIIIFNGDGNKISMFNDRTSTRPIWYNTENEAFYAANIPSAIAALRKNRTAINEIGLWSLLATGRHTGELGLFEGVKILPSGSELILNGKGLNNKKWYNLQYKPDYNLGIKDWGERIASELKESAGKILSQYKDINLFLSGGMDSRVAAGAFGDKINSITLTTRDNMNSRISEKVANVTGSNHKTVYRNPDWYLSSFASSALISAGNYKISHAHFSSLFKQDNKYFNHTFVLGDLLENFNKHYFKIPLEKLSAENFAKKYNKVYSYSVKNFDELENLFAAGKGKIIRGRWEEYLLEEAKKIEKVSEYKEDFADAFFRWQNNTVCPTYLMHESIRPFASLVNLMFDNKLIDTLLSVPHELKSAGKLHNHILKNLNSRLLYINNSNFWLPPAAPRFIADYAMKIRPMIGKIRRKLKAGEGNGPLILTEGSWDMLHERYRKDKAYTNTLQDVILNEEIFPVELFNRNFIEKSYSEFMEGNLQRTTGIELLFSFGLLKKNLSLNEVHI